MRIFEAASIRTADLAGAPSSPDTPALGWDARSRGGGASPRAPDYLEKHYWWAYVRPGAVRVFERQWLVNAILWGNYGRLRDTALDSLGTSLPGRTLQIACAYGDLSVALGERVAAGGGRLDVVDVLPTQLDNLRQKLPPNLPVAAHLMDSAVLSFPDGAFDRVLLFFLLHEQPVAWRRKTLAEALRVVKPGGRVVIVDYSRPEPWNPMRYLFAPVLALLEPFALDLWRESLRAWLPRPWSEQPLRRRSFFGGLYQEVILEK